MKTLYAHDAYYAYEDNSEETFQRWLLYRYTVGENLSLHFYTGGVGLHQVLYTLLRRP